MRGHEPIVLEEFNGLWARGGADSCPLDHFSECNNIRFIQSGFGSRYGIDPFLPYGDPLRIVTFISQISGVVREGLIILNSIGQFFYTASPSPFIPFLTIVGATSFGFTSFAGRAYITPRKTYVDPNGDSQVYGLQGEFLYVYKGDASPARRAGGDAPTVAPSVAIIGPGNVDVGVRIYAIAFETDTGFISAPSPKTVFTIPDPDAKTVQVSNIQIGSSIVVARWLVMTQAIIPADYTGDPNNYELFFVRRIGDNTTTAINVSVFDSELIRSADYLNDLFTNIPAGVGLNTYHGRLVSVGEYDNISVARVSEPGQPEAFNQVTGLIVVPLDGRPLTVPQEYRDNLFLFKQTRTFSYVDNGDVPSSWPISVIDQGMGSAPDGVATILDSGGINIEFLIIGDYSGVVLFNGTYIRPELSWKIRDFWLALERSIFCEIQLLNDSINQIVYCILPDGQMLIADYSNGMDYEKVRWAPWTFDIRIRTIALLNTNQLIIGSVSGLV